MSRLAGHDSEPNCAAGYKLVYYGSSLSCQPIPTAEQSSIDDEQGYYGAESQYYASIAPPPAATESQATADATPITPCRYARLNCDADMPNKAWDANGKPPPASGCSWLGCLGDLSTDALASAAGVKRTRARRKSPDQRPPAIW
jgi:hypothetical protein